MIDLRATIVLIALCRTAAADHGAETVEVDGEALASPLDPWIGGSLHYEHRFADSKYGLTLRGGVATGEDVLDDGKSFTKVSGIIGLREHWGLVYFEASAGWTGIRRTRFADGEAQRGTHWDHGPDFEVEVGRRIGPVNLGVFAALLGLGVRVGFAIGD